MAAPQLQHVLSATSRVLFLLRCADSIRLNVGRMDLSGAEVRCFDQNSLSFGDESHLQDFPAESSDFIGCDMITDGENGAEKCGFNGASFIKKSDSDEKIGQSHNDFLGVKYFGTYFHATQSLARVPACCLYTRDFVLACRWIEDLRGFESREEATRVMEPFFIASALAGHYDVGSSGNSMLHGVFVYFVDFGGVFEYTGTGEQKLVHRCEKNEDYVCESRMRRCHSASWGVVPYQILDFRFGPQDGGWDGFPVFWGHLNGNTVKAQFDSSVAALRAAVSATCIHTSDYDIDMRVCTAMSKRLRSLVNLFSESKEDFVGSEVLDMTSMGPTNRDTYWAACRAMRETAMLQRPVRTRILKKSAAGNGTIQRETAVVQGPARKRIWEKSPASNGSIQTKKQRI